VAIYTTVAVNSEAFDLATGWGYVRRLRVLPPDSKGIQRADIWLEMPSGTVYTFSPKQEVQVAALDSVTGFLYHRWFGGFVRKRVTGRVPAQTTRIVRITCYGYGVLADTLVGGAAYADRITIASANLGTQIASLLSQVKGAASGTIDYTVWASGTFHTAVLPAITFQGLSLRRMIEELLRGAERTIPGVQGRWYMGYDTPTGSGALFGNPRVYLFDAAAVPPAAATVRTFSDAPGGSDKPIYLPFARGLDSSFQWTRRQSIHLSSGNVFTASSATAILSYPNRFSPDNAWMREPLLDHETGDPVYAQNLIDRDVYNHAFPADNPTFWTTELVQVFDWIRLTWSDDSLSSAVYQVTGYEMDFTVPNKTWSKLWCQLRPGALPPGEGAGPPQPPTNLATTVQEPNPYGGDTGTWGISWTASTDIYRAFYEIQTRIDIDQDGLNYTPWREVARVLADPTNGVTSVLLPGLYLEEKYELRMRTINTFEQPGPWSSTLTEIIEHRPATFLVNPSFEEPRAVKLTRPAGWFVANVASGSTVTWEDSTSYEGKISCMLHHGGVAGQNPTIRSRKLRASASRTYIVDVATRGSSAAANFYGWINWYNRTGGLISSTSFASAAALSTPGFTLNQYKVTAPANTASLDIEMWTISGASYDAYVDAVNIQPQVTSAELQTFGPGAVTKKLATITTDATGRVSALDERAGVAFPGSPSANDFYYRTDLGILCQYDGTQWLGPTRAIDFQHYSDGLGPFNGSFTAFIATKRTNRKWLITAFAMFGQVLTNDGSNYFNVKLQYVNSGGATSDMATLDTSTWSAATFSHKETSSIATHNPMDASDIAFVVSGEVGAGAPADCYIWVEGEFREVIA
jgi:hypothetical protein